MKKQSNKNKDNSYAAITIWSLLRRHVFGNKLIVLMACLAVTSGITFLRPLVIKGITDEGMLKANLKMIIEFAVLLLVFVVIEQGINIIQSKQFAIIQNSMMLDLYQAVFDKMLRLRKGYFSDHNSADIINRTTMDIRSVSVIADRSVLFVLSYILGQHRRTRKRKGPAGRFHPAGQIYTIPSVLQPH